MKKIILFLSIFAMLSCGGNPAQHWDALQRDIRDGAISKQAALAKIKILHTELVYCSINTYSALLGIFTTAEKKRLPWVTGEFITKRIAHIQTPDGFSRIDVTSKSFGEFLRELPLKKGKAVYLFDGRKKANQRAQYAVIDIDVGKRDLQQCADAIMRLRAEYLYYHERYDEISFNFVSGFKCSFEKWSKGFGVKIQGNKVLWKNAPKNDTGYASFKRYLIMVFSYANTSSLEKEMTSVTDPSKMEIGDTFIQGGFPGHAVIIVDIAENDKGEKIFLLGQSYMPAQDFHILNSPDRISPWYVIPENGILDTPEWEFHLKDLKRF